MFLISIFVSFGNLFRDYYGGLNVVALLAINLFLFNGIAARRIKHFKSETLLLTIGFSIALLVIVSMVFTWTQYGFFYALRYKGLRYFYYGTTYDISLEGYWLSGFQFKETFLSYSGVYATLLTCYLFLYFLSVQKRRDKEDILFIFKHWFSWIDLFNKHSLFKSIPYFDSSLTYLPILQILIKK